jgi:cellulose biosynthesis protein BcsQ
MRHLDEARNNALIFLRSLLETDTNIEKAVLIDDIYGKLRLLIWRDPKSDSEEIYSKINKGLNDKEIAKPFWTCDIWDATNSSQTDKTIYKETWEEAILDEKIATLKILDRYRNRGSWFTKPQNPPWPLNNNTNQQSIPIIVFYSFKGGVGRSTALASYAIQRARMGEKIVVLDLDFDAPGIGQLISVDNRGSVAQWGIVDYLLEVEIEKPDLKDYYHVCRNQKIVGEGEIIVFPSGKIDDYYPKKIARIDLDIPLMEHEIHPIIKLLNQIKGDLQPNCIIIDARSGLSEMAGFLLSGVAHNYVIFGTTSEQSWAGIKLVLDRLGREMILNDLPQKECFIVQAMIPQDKKAQEYAKTKFLERSYDEFSNYYYLNDSEEELDDNYWYISDTENEGAPHIPICISYLPQFAHFDNLEDIANDLAILPEYKNLMERIFSRLNIDVIDNEPTS